jgi:hypothetical protein
MRREQVKAVQSGSVDIGESDWASGVYTIRFTPKGSKPTVKKMILQR